MQSYLIKLLPHRHRFERARQPLARLDADLAHLQPRTASPSAPLSRPNDTESISLGIRLYGLDSSRHAGFSLEGST